MVALPNRALWCLLRFINVRVKLRYVFPAAQMALAVGLIWWSDQWFKVQMRLQDMPGPAPAFRLCISINAPIALPRALIFRHLSASWDYVVLVLAVGILWYWVALNVESWRRNRAVLGFRWIPLRLAVNLLLIAMGAFWGLTFIVEVRGLRLRIWIGRARCGSAVFWALCLHGPLC